MPQARPFHWLRQLLRQHQQCLRAPAELDVWDGAIGAETRSLNLVSTKQKEKQVFISTKTAISRPDLESTAWRWRSVYLIAQEDKEINAMDSMDALIV